MARTAAALAALTILLGVVRAVTPVEKVVELLENLAKKVEEEGKGEAAAYDKYACFCKEQMDEKQYQIEKSDAEIAELGAKISKLSSEIGTLNGEIGDLVQAISGWNDAVKNNQAIRDAEHADYKTKAADAAGAIDACKRAIEALKASKEGMAGHTDLEAVGFLQVQRAAALALAFSSAQMVAISDDKLQMLGDLAKQEPGTAYQSTYHSNAIIETIEGLQQSFTNILNALDQDEFDKKSQHDTKQLALSHQIQFGEKEKAEKEALVAEKDADMQAKTVEKDQETNDRNSDANFQAVLVNDCEEKAKLWDQRSASRSAELTAISEAMSALKEGVAPNWQANKNLVGLAQKKAMAPAASFLQLRGSRSNSQKEAKAALQAQQVLQNAGIRLSSRALSLAALRVSVSEDHFVKVRQIIKDLLERLDEQAKAEASQKSFCDGEMAREVEGRDTQQGKVEDYKAQIEVKESERQQLLKEIAELSAAIAANQKALQEATDLRTKEHLENEKTVQDAGAGKEAVEYALTVLKQYYQGTSFLQYVPPNSDREGQTVSDRAPEVFDAEYKGSLDASKGIIGMLEVILSDFDRTGTTVTGQEEDAQTAYDNFKTANELDTSNKETLKSTKEGEVTVANDKLVSLENDKMAAQDLHNGHVAALESLRSMCVEGEETYEERVAKRKQEIEALKEAHDILENWNK